jgi:4-aminobutyrate aminotransferase/(S)-3-amino-2-methylpropionate transaminase
MLKTHAPGEAAIMIAEPILGVGGIIVPPDGYWKKVQDICKRYSITLIMDEVFTGFGRTGKMFAHQHWDLSPDVITFAKAVGGGVPLGGFASTDEMASTFDPGDHFTTFGSNNQIGMAAAHAVLDVLAEEKLPEKAEKSGLRFVNGLNELKKRLPLIGDIRGKGLMIGIELVKDHKTKTPAVEEVKSVQQELRRNGILVSTTGNYGCVVRITPPLMINEQQIDNALNEIERSIEMAARAS